MQEINLQEDKSKAKAYQVKQVRMFLVENNLAGRKRLMTQYEIILYWSRQDQVYTAEVPELAGCMAHGDTQEYALANDCSYSCLAIIKLSV